MGKQVKGGVGGGMVYLIQNRFLLKIYFIKIRLNKWELYV